MSECIQCDKARNEELERSRQKAIDKGREAAITANEEVYYIYIHTAKGTKRPFYRFGTGEPTEQYAGIEYYTVL